MSQSLFLNLNENDEYSKEESIYNKKFTENDRERLIQTNYNTAYKIDQTHEELNNNDESSQNELDKLSFNKLNADDTETIDTNDNEIENVDDKESIDINDDEIENPERQKRRKRKYAYRIKIKPNTT